MLCDICEDDFLLTKNHEYCLAAPKKEEESKVPEEPHVPEPESEEPHVPTPKPEPPKSPKCASFCKTCTNSWTCTECKDSSKKPNKRDLTISTVLATALLVRGKENTLLIILILIYMHLPFTNNFSLLPEFLII